MFHLRWQKSVSRALLDRCARADQSLRDAILDAMAEIETTLRNEPEFTGESRGAGKRCLIVDPLSITFKIDHRRRVVYIVGARVRRMKN
jgi:hypothetical protein